MYPVKMAIPGLEGVNAPDVCCNQPETNKIAFCHMHKELALQKGIPTDIKGFIKYCGTSISGECMHINKIYKFCGYVII